MSIKGQESGTGKGTFGPDRVRPSVVVVFAEHQDRCARETNEVFAQSANRPRPSVRALFLLAGWIRTIGEEEGKAGRSLG